MSTTTASGVDVGKERGFSGLFSFISEPNTIAMLIDLCLRKRHMHTTVIAVIRVPEEATYLSRGQDGNPLPFSSCLAVADPTGGERDELVIVEKGHRGQKNFVIYQSVLREGIVKDGKFVPQQDISTQVYAVGV